VRGKSLHHDIVAFARALRAAGLRVGVDQSESFARALTLVDATARREFYLAARATLVCRHEDLALFDSLFATFWTGAQARAPRPQKVPLAPRHDRAALQRTAFAAYMAQKAQSADPEAPVPERAKAASGLELLQTKDFSDLTADELRALARALRELRFEPARRTTRRRVAARRGRTLDWRRTLRSSARCGGALVTLPKLRRKVKCRPLVVLADISGSMELYSRILLQFLHGLTRLYRDTETFVFGTRLTRITGPLRLRSVDLALDHASAAIVDFAGGTRIGECLATFRRLHAARVLRRGAVVLVISDGWETGDARVLGSEMARLKSRCHRLIWLNPLAGRSTYRPLAAGMATCLEHIDDFLPIHNLHSLLDLSRHVARLSSRKAPRSAHPRVCAPEVS
jgi:uncharacterized protein with von Willebrand factor type A (vWA) domain